MRPGAVQGAGAHLGFAISEAGGGDFVGFLVGGLLGVGSFAGGEDGP